MIVGAKTCRFSQRTTGTQTPSPMRLWAMVTRLVIPDELKNGLVPLLYMLRQFLWLVSRMSHAGWMLDERLGIPQTDVNSDQ
jgi:hypothetical protein